MDQIGASFPSTLYLSVLFVFFVHCRKLTSFLPFPSPSFSLVGGANRPPPPTANRGEGAGGAEGSNLGGAFNELKMKMNERGEKLNELDAKFQEMNAASSDFLKSVREYNERQAQKKWYEF